MNTALEIMTELGPVKVELLHHKVYEAFNQPFRIITARKIANNKYDVDIVLQNNDKRTVTV